MADMLYNAIGSVGVIVLLSAYFLLQTERLQAYSLNYSLLYLLGSGMILISLLYDFNLPSFLIKLSWAVISMMGILPWFKQSQRVKFHE
jgi:hypothetical protein